MYSFKLWNLIYIDTFRSIIGINYSLNLHFAHSCVSLPVTIFIAYKAALSIRIHIQCADTEHIGCNLGAGTEGFIFQKPAYFLSGI